MKKFIRYIFVVFLLLLSVNLSGILKAQQKAGYAYEQNKKLGRGVNIMSPDARWTNREKARFTEKHFKLLKTGGFDNVRLVMHPFRSVKSETDFTLNNVFLRPSIGL